MAEPRELLGSGFVVGVLREPGSIAAGVRVLLSLLGSMLPVRGWKSGSRTQKVSDLKVIAELCLLPKPES